LVEILVSIGQRASAHPGPIGLGLRFVSALAFFDALPFRCRPGTKICQRCLPFSTLCPLALALLARDKDLSATFAFFDALLCQNWHQKIACPLACPCTLPFSSLPFPFHSTPSSISVLFPLPLTCISKKITNSTTHLCVLSFIYIFYVTNKTSFSFFNPFILFKFEKNLKKNH
jgi:hypothetical protein